MSAEVTEEKPEFTPGTLASINHKLCTVPSIQVGKFEMRFESNDLDDFLKEKARKELRETPENIEEGVRKLRELLKGEPDLILFEEDELLYRFLRPCKWYPNSAFGLMKRFFQYQINYPRYCKDLLPSNERAVMVSGIITPLPKRTPDGIRLVLVEGGKKWKPKEVSLDQIYKGIMLHLHAAITEPVTQVAGIRVIFDMEGLSLSQVTHFTPSFASAVVDWVQNCLPCRLKGIHIVNQPFIFNMVFTFFKPFLHEKLRKRIFFHGTDRESLLAAIPAKVVPTRYGGELEIPSEPIGEPLWSYFCNFDEDYAAANTIGYVSKMKGK